MIVYYAHKMFERLTVDYKNLIIYPTPPAHYLFGPAYSRYRLS